jgi:hypothetical protein
VADALAGLPDAPQVTAAFAGLGGADVSEPTWEAMLDDARAVADGAPPGAPRIYHEGAAL